MLVFIVKRQNILRNNMVFLLLKDRKENLKMPTHKTAHLQICPDKYIQSLLGHSSSKTTEIYTHITTKGFDKIENPLDKLKI